MSNINGRCYELAAEAILGAAKNDSWLRRIGGWVLVHGVVTGTGNGLKGKQFGHAWLENETLVYDAADGRLYEREGYYQAGKIKEVFKYSRDETLRLLLETEHYGPWENRLYADDLEG